MDLNDDQKEIVELFLKQEFLIGKLYKLFSFRYPEYKVFWTEMASEEHLHASWIKRLIKTDSFRFSQGELRSHYLASSINSIEELTAEVRNNREFSIAQAVNAALRIERSLYEKEIFQSFEGDSEHVRKMLYSLCVEQQIHIKKMEMFASTFSQKNH
ncbi:MAG TPA: hypothetical protein HPP94_13470 [Desulfuromonadales bacterium]|nr:hypothetical protein [Desulfuromonadales bacterium]